LYELVAELQDHHAPQEDQQILEESENSAQGPEEPQAEHQKGKLGA
jgi:hypothetical protein